MTKTRPGSAGRWCCGASRSGSSRGRAEGGYTDAYELVCCECGDHPDLDFREISPELQQIRGPYQIAVGIAAYQRHVSRYHRRQGDHHPGRAEASRHGLTAPG